MYKIVIKRGTIRFSGQIISIRCFTIYLGIIRRYLHMYNHLYTPVTVELCTDKL